MCVRAELETVESGRVKCVRNHVMIMETSMEMIIVMVMMTVVMITLRNDDNKT